VLGHEGAGEVVEVGEGVTDLAVGDHVVASFVYMCGKCRFCVSGRPVLCLDQNKALTTPREGTPRVHDRAGNPVGIFSGCGVMADYATMSVENVIRIDPKIPLDRAALVGCAVTTGVGAVFNTARVEPGATVAVFGCGGVGLNAIQGAAIAGAEIILAIDTMQSKLDLAKKFGATHTLLSKPGEDPTKEIKKLTESNIGSGGCKEWGLMLFAISTSVHRQVLAHENQFRPLQYPCQGRGRRSATRRR
jgi:S-(hydroxymethyl)glutathione dehydrogenase/alcohol dehydrogenase